MHSAISYNAENISFTIKNKRILSDWIKEIAKREGKNITTVSFIFCDDKFLLKLNKKYLKHDTFTDIITFDYCEGGLISGDIFISIERVRENAVKFSKPFKEELCRVMCHGILHLAGFSDKKNSEMLAMRAKEDDCLILLKEKFMFHVKQFNV
jgi:probable rRNA maturation factor